jgi:hypothetical protein
VQETVEVDGLPVRVKVSAGRVKVEHDDAARVARRTGRPLREVVARAEQAGRGEPAASPAAARDEATAALVAPTRLHDHSHPPDDDSDAG